MYPHLNIKGVLDQCTNTERRLVESVENGVGNLGPSPRLPTAIYVIVTIEFSRFFFGFTLDGLREKTDRSYSNKELMLCTMN